MNGTHQRRAAIRGLLREQRIQSQAELLDLLGKRGISISQPMLSRDLRALRAAKQEGAYQVVEPERVTPLTALSSLLRSSAPATAFEVVRCEPGAASAVARALEAEGIEGVAGTVAGDDTVFVALTTKSAGCAVEEFLPGVHDAVLGRAEVESSATQGPLLGTRPSAAIDREGRDLVPVLARQPSNEPGRIETAGVGQEDSHRIDSRLR